MKKIVSLLLIFGLVASVSPGIVEVSSTPLGKREMACTLGGTTEDLDCEKIAAGTYAVCIGAGGGWLECTIVAAGAYLACLAANAIIPD